MPLQKGRSRKTVAKNIREFHGGKTYKATEEKFGKAKANRQAVAVALSEARKSGGKPKPKTAKTKKTTAKKESFW